MKKKKKRRRRSFIKETSIKSRLAMIFIELWSTKFRKLSVNSMITCVSGRN
jgi:hypothetical protein